MTFSIAARCLATGMFGVAVSSSSPAVAARCAHARAGVGAMASQNVTDPSLGTRGLDLMALGASAAEAVAVLKATGAHIEHRQLTAVDAPGRVAVYHGATTLGTHANTEGAGVIAAGNILRDAGAPQAMVAALIAGGEEGPVHSAGMTLVDEVPWPVADLRVDWSDDDPVQALARLWALYRPQMDDCVTRALNPEAAPSYGVPGNE